MCMCVTQIVLKCNARIGNLCTLLNTLGMLLWYECLNPALKFELSSKRCVEIPLAASKFLCNEEKCFITLYLIVSGHQ